MTLTSCEKRHVILRKTFICVPLPPAEQYSLLVLASGHPLKANIAMSIGISIDVSHRWTISQIQERLEEISKEQVKMVGTCNLMKAKLLVLLRKALPPEQEKLFQYFRQRYLAVSSRCFFRLIRAAEFVLCLEESNLQKPKAEQILLPTGEMQIRWIASDPKLAQEEKIAIWKEAVQQANNQLPTNLQVKAISLEWKSKLLLS